MAPRAGLEPTTTRLTAGCSTIELRLIVIYIAIIARPLLSKQFRVACYSRKSFNFCFDGVTELRGFRLNLPDTLSGNANTWPTSSSVRLGRHPARNAGVKPSSLSVSESVHPQLFLQHHERCGFRRCGCFRVFNEVSQMTLPPRQWSFQ